MIYIISLLGIIIETSLPFTANILVVTLSFLIYLVNIKKEKAMSIIGIIVIILSLQTNDIFKLLVIFYLSYYILNYIFLHLVYEKSNILFFLVFQGILYGILSKNNFNLKYLLVNMIGFIILNFVYIHISKNKVNELKG
ncbi:hypothetical protein [uncultured Fusobacterium sp.]|uniref:hypothetical protein n=1 Tax=uncultured Fusobacterium sp. TaxID=159267 RepID=UPI0025FFA9E4|nr:hypothetical protein [uncultured Fusobacterium sp.]